MSTKITRPKEASSSPCEFIPGSRRLGARLGIVSGMLLLVLLWAAPAWALFDLSASPRKGGRDLRFDLGLSTAGAREEELTLSVDTDQTTPYRIYMTYLTPLTNEQGHVLTQDSLYVFSPTNSLGDLRLKLESPLPLGQTIVYTSNSTGSADQLTLVFHLNLPPDVPGGRYRASLSFTLEPVMPTAGLPPQTVTLELRAEAKTDFRFTVRNEKGAERLDLGQVTKNSLAYPGVLNFQIESNAGQPYRIFQELRGPLTSEAGVALGEEGISYSVEGAEEGKAAPDGKLTSAPVLLFDSGSGGASSQFQVVYRTDLFPEIPAGRITGTLFFRVESASPFAANQSAQLPVVLEVDPIFNLDIEIPDGLGLQFGNLKSGEEAPEKHILLKVQSNLHQPYQVSQMVSRKMSTLDGAALPDESFRYFVQRPATGVVEAVALRPVPVGESPLFLSDSSGTPETLACTYVLSIPANAKSGPYGTDIKYSITTL